MVSQAGQDRSDDRGDPEHPERRECPSADNECRTGAPGRVDGSVGDRNTDQVDQRKTEADSQPGKPFGGALAGLTITNMKVRIISMTGPAASE